MCTRYRLWVRRFGIHRSKRSVHDREKLTCRIALLG